MRILVTSASGANGDGYGTVLAFGPEGELAGPFSRDPRITDPRGMSVDPSGAVVYLNSGDDRILALNLHGDDGRIYLSSGVAPSGEGGNTIAMFDRSGALRTPRLVNDPELSPLDLKLAPNGNVVVASEWPFGAPDAVTSVREYDPATGQLVRVFAPGRSVGFRRPRG